MRNLFTFHKADIVERRRLNSSWRAILFQKDALNAGGSPVTHTPWVAYMSHSGSTIVAGWYYGFVLCNKPKFKGPHPNRYAAMTSMMLDPDYYIRDKG